MKRSAIAIVAIAAVCVFGSAANAHFPADYLGPIYGWTTPPVLDANLQEWEQAPEEFWITEQDMNKTSTRPWAHDRPIDASSLSFRFLPSWHDGTNRLYFALESFDDKAFENGAEDFQLGIDGNDGADGTNAGAPAEGTDEEKEIGAGRLAQVIRYNFASPNCHRPEWNWFWQTSATWHIDNPEVADAVYDSPDACSRGESNVIAEWYQVAYDDWNWKDQAASVATDLETDNVIMMSVIRMDTDDDFTELGDDCDCFERWSIAPTNLDGRNTEFWPDHQLLAPEGDGMMTAVEDNSWGRIKASMAQ